MVTYGPDVNVSLPPAMTEALDVQDLHAKVNYYAPALTAVTAASPFFRGALWEVHGRIGPSVRTHHRSVWAPALEVHLDQGGRLELKSLETPHCIDDFYAYFLAWLTLLLDDGLSGRADDESRIYDLGCVARDGLGAEGVGARLAEILRRAPDVLSRHAFDPTPLEVFEHRLTAKRVPSHDLIDLYLENRDVCTVMRHLHLRDGTPA
jgi:hypothetical protein